MILHLIIKALNIIIVSLKTVYNKTTIIMNNHLDNTWIGKYRKSNNKDRCMQLASHNT